MIINGDSVKELKKLKDNSVDLLCTDPPYGYSFMGKDWDKAVPSVELWKECLRVLKPGAFAFVMSAPRSDVLSRMIVRIEDAGFRVDFTPIYWTYASGFPKAMNIGKMVDKRGGLHTPKLVPTKRGNLPEMAGAVALGATGFTDISERVSKEAKALDGSYGGFQPKPAVEVIIVAMKPLSEKTYVDQALKNRKGITWLDDCRVPTQERRIGGKDLSKTREVFGTYHPLEARVYEDGRFPANLLVSDDVLNDGIERKSGIKDLTRAYEANSENDYGKRGPAPGTSFGDSGSYSRFFDLDTWAKTLPFLIVPKASKREKGKENKHPTVKPLKLMSYLITLGSRPGDVVLDPFLGSGTTALAAKQLNRQYIGIEREKEYVEIARARLVASNPAQPTLLAAE